jgi:hypothetical protein
MRRRRHGVDRAALVLRVAVLALQPVALSIPALASATTIGSFIVTNDDLPNLHPPDGPPGSTVTFYSVESSGVIDNATTVNTKGVGIGGGTFAAHRIAIVPQSNDVCVFASDASTSDIAALSATTRTLIGNFFPATSDSGIANGIGLLTSGSFLYASYTSSSTIATFSIGSGCTLTYVGDLLAVGLNGGLVTGMATHGSMLIVTYGDGSIESFNIAKGMPVSNGDVQNSTGYANDYLPGGVDITADGHFAIFGDASTVATVEVSDISSGKLTETVAYNLGPYWNSGNVQLTPDESLIVVTNPSGGSVTAARFDSTTGRVRVGCTSGPLKGFYDSFSYVGAAVVEPSGAGEYLLYVPEFGGGSSSIAAVQLSYSGTTCTLQELSGSPIASEARSNLLSVGMYPLRAF